MLRPRMWNGHIDLLLSVRLYVRPYIPIWLSFAFRSVSKKLLALYQYYFNTTFVLYGTTEVNNIFNTLTYILRMSYFG
jgi:hypothetical protein